MYPSILITSYKIFSFSLPMSLKIIFSQILNQDKPIMKFTIYTNRSADNNRKSISINFNSDKYKQNMHNKIIDLSTITKATIHTMVTDKNNTSQDTIIKANTQEIMIESIKIERDKEIINREIVMVGMVIIKEEIELEENMVDIEKISIKKDTIKLTTKRISSNKNKKQLLSNHRLKFKKLKKLLYSLKSQQQYQNLSQNQSDSQSVKSKSLSIHFQKKICKNMLTLKSLKRQKKSALGNVNKQKLR